MVVLPSHSSPSPWDTAVALCVQVLTNFSAQGPVVCVLWEKDGDQTETSCLHELLRGHIEPNTKTAVAFQPACTLGCSQSEMSDGLIFCSSMAPKMEIWKTGHAWADSVYEGR